VAGLVTHADVVVQSYRPGALDARDLSPDAIAERDQEPWWCASAASGPRDRGRAAGAGSSWRSRHRGWRGPRSRASPGSCPPRRPTTPPGTWRRPVWPRPCATARMRAARGWSRCRSPRRRRGSDGSVRTWTRPGEGFGDLHARACGDREWGWLTHLAPIERFRRRRPVDTPPVERILSARVAHGVVRPSPGSPPPGSAGARPPSCGRIGPDPIEASVRRPAHEAMDERGRGDSAPRRAGRRASPRRTRAG
jgi:hypothetical protein